MSKVSQAFSLTFKVGPKRDQWAKINLEVTEIDTEQPIEDQLRNIDDVVQRTWEFLRNKLVREVEEIMKETATSSD